jgi:phosphohistidine phosphatase
MSVLYFVRHASAEDPRPGKSDAERALTPDGIRKFRRAARGIVKLTAPAPPKRILTSPLLRARQTAELLAEAFERDNLTLELRGLPALGPPGSLPGLLKEVGERNILVIGHEPLLSSWIGQLCFGGPGELLMKKGALAAVELFRPAQGRLLFLLPPAVLRGL